jgi:hypothetical protein
MAPSSRVLEIGLPIAVILGQQVALAQQPESPEAESEDKPYPRAVVRPPPNDDGPMGSEFLLESHMRKGLLVSGLSIGGGLYASSVVVGAMDGYANSKGYMLVPLLGPWITLAKRRSPHCGGSAADPDDCRTSGLTPMVLLLDGMGQLAGSILVTVYLTAPAYRWAPKITSNITVTPVVQRGTNGAMVSGTF